MDWLYRKLMTLIRLGHGNLTRISTGPLRRCGADKDLRLLTQFKKNRSAPPPNIRCYLLDNIVGSSYGTCIVLIKCRDNFATKRIKYYPSFLKLKCRLVGQLIKLHFET